MHGTQCACPTPLARIHTASARDAPHYKELCCILHCLRTCATHAASIRGFCKSLKWTGAHVPVSFQPDSLNVSVCRRGHFYPGTGGVDEVGEGAGEGYSVNVPWPMGGMGNGDYMAAFNHVIMPIAYEYQPELIIISAGFDASIGDPIGG